MSKLYFLVILAIIFLLSVHTLTSINQDIGRHLTLGRMILENWQIPKTNLFSYTNADFPFINHHWLGEVFLYLLTSFTNLKWLILLKAIIVTFSFGLVLKSHWSGQSALSIAIVALLSAFIFSERTDVRPEIFSFLFFAWYIYVLNAHQDDRRFLWTLPAVQLVWVNTHIYFFMGPVAIMLFLISKVILGAKLSDVGRKYGPFVVAIALVSFINPNFWRGAFYPLMMFGNYGYSIVENKGPFFLRAWGYPWFTTWSLFAGAGVTFLLTAINHKKWRENFFNTSLSIVTFGLSLAMIRNYPLFALSMLALSSSQISQIKIVVKDFKINLAVLAVLVVVAFGVVQDKIGPPFSRFGLDVPSGGQDAVDFVRANSIKGPMFNNFDQGSFLIWKMPEEKVFIDGRPEAYPADFIQNVYIKMQEDPQKWKEYSDKYGINYVFWNWQDITPWSQKFLASMIGNKEWPLVYRDGSIVIFLKKSPQNEEILKRLAPNI